MDFDLSEEQQLLKDSVARLMADRYDFDRRKDYAKAPEGFSIELWRQYAELGLLGLSFDDAHGGIGDSGVGTMIVMQALGSALALEPYLATVVLGGGLVRHGGSAAQKDAILPKIADGSLRFAFAQAERQSRYNLADVKTTAKASGDSWILEGEKSLVLHGDSADQLVVAARTSGAQRERNGISLFLVDAKAAGVSRRGYPTQDGQRAAEISFAQVALPRDALIGKADAALPLIERVVDEARAALCAEAVGAMEAMHALTVEYLKTRKQFGVTIGSFQALQHRAVDMFVALEQARSMAMLAAMTAQDADPAARSKIISAAKAQIGRSGKFVGEQAVQLHGGVGMTMELKVGHYFKRVTMIDTLFGDADHHLSRLAEAGGII
ncbi:MAG: acyl-CoA dehydrogenase family protein [Variibacter sp.]